MLSCIITGSQDTVLSLWSLVKYLGLSHVTQVGFRCCLSEVSAIIGVMIVTIFVKYIGTYIPWWIY